MSRLCHKLKEVLEKPLDPSMTGPMSPAVQAAFDCAESEDEDDGSKVMSSILVAAGNMARCHRATMHVAYIDTIDGAHQDVLEESYRKARHSIVEIAISSAKIAVIEQLTLLLLMRRLQHQASQPQKS